MTISLIVAHDKNRVIGYQNKMPWHLPADLQHFKCITMGKPIVMGRKTFESIGKALPGRRNIVVTRDRNFQAEGVVVAHSFEDAVKEATNENDVNEIMIIGGEQLFKLALPHASRIYLTIIDAEFPGDTYFSALNWDEWQVIDEEKHVADEKNPCSYSFLMLEKKVLR